MSVSSASPKLPPVIQLRPYQQRWVDDQARFKGSVKSARIGFSFGTAVEAVLDCLPRRTTWTYMSASAPQAVEFMTEGVGKIKDAMQFTAQIYNEPYADELGRTDLIQHRCEFSNGSRIIALPCNPRTARGYPGNAILDEYAHVEESYSVWAAITRQLALGHKLRVLSTPNGEQGKFFDLAREAGLTDGIAPSPNPLPSGAWSWHWINCDMAIAEGCPINMQEMRQLYKGDEETLLQEFYCVFLKAIGAWLSLDLVAAAEDDDCDGVVVTDPGALSMAEVESRLAGGRLSLGIDFGRSGDRTLAWLREDVGDVGWCRLAFYLHNVPFFSADGKDQAHYLEPLVALADRTALDSTGMGIPLYEYFNSKYQSRVMGVNFAGSIKRMRQGDAQTRADSGLAESVKIKTDMAVRMKRRFEERKDRIPHDPQLRAELMAVKREQTSNAVTFDAPRIEVDSAIAGGARKKVYSHAEAFWAKAMADLAAERIGGSMMDAFLAGAPRPSELEFAPMTMGDV